jgi:hypothetical protein
MLLLRRQRIERTYNNPVPLDGVQRGLLLDDITLSFEALLLFSEAAFEDGICRDYLHELILDTIPGVVK